MDSWNQTHTSTGRLSTSLPSLQNLPRGTKTVEEEEEEESDDEADFEAQAAGSAEADTEGRRASKAVLREINIRDCFRPESNDSLYLSADFNQMEMRIMSAHQARLSTCTSGRQHSLIGSSSLTLFVCLLLAIACVGRTCLRTVS